MIFNQWRISGRGLGEPAPHLPLILGEKEEMTEGRKAAGRASESKPPPPAPPLSSKSGSATVNRFISSSEAKTLIRSN